MKWYHVEKNKGIYDWTRGDAISDLFENWKIPLSGNTILWEVDQCKDCKRPNAAPEWFGNEFSSQLAAGEDMSELKETVLEWVDTVVSRYAGRNQNWKVFNEPLHGDLYRANFDNMWEDVISTIRMADPQATITINDHDLVSSNQGSMVGKIALFAVIFMPTGKAAVHFKGKNVSMFIIV